ncbi:MAG: hypothetical protein ACRETX_17215 [Steroidobacteraceae bacterium]
MGDAPELRHQCDRLGSAMVQAIDACTRAERACGDDAVVRGALVHLRAELDALARRARNITKWLPDPTPRAG